MWPLREIYENFWPRNNLHQDYLDREMFGADRFESCSSPDFYCDGGCKPGFNLYQTPIAETVHIGSHPVLPLNPYVSLKDFDVMAVLTVLTGRMRSIAKNWNHKSVAVLYLLKKQKKWILTYLILSLDIANGIFRRQKGIFSGHDHNSNYVKSHLLLWYIFIGVSFGHCFLETNSTM